MEITPHAAGLAVTDPSAFTDEVRLHAALALLRRADPVQLTQELFGAPDPEVGRGQSTDDLMAVRADRG